MSFKNAIISIINRLRTIDVKSADGNDNKLFSTVFNNQIERKKNGSSYVYPLPACFVEMSFDEGIPVGDGVSCYECVVTLMLETEHYNTEGGYDENYTALDLRNKIHRKLIRFKPDYCSPLIAIKGEINYDHDNSNLLVFQYKTTLTDLTGTIYDSLNEDYIEALLNNPELIIESDIEPNPYVDEVIAQSILSENGDIINMEINNNPIILE